MCKHTNLVYLIYSILTVASNTDLYRVHSLLFIISSGVARLARFLSLSDSPPLRRCLLEELIWLSSSKKSREIF